MKHDIRTYSLVQLQEYFKQIQQPVFRAKQVYEWLWKKGVTSFDEMTNISLPIREKLEDSFVIPTLKIAEAQKSKDRTIKTAFELHDGNIVEGVLIPTMKRMTACISSQVGCSLTCKFCATGKLSRIRNLTSYEIVDQVRAIAKQALTDYKSPLTNIVYMGMGEPLLNYKNVTHSIQMITSPEGLGMSYHRVTLSTAGIAKMIKQLADDGIKCNLALSLHAANDQKRNKIMPINEHNTLATLAEGLIYYYDKMQLPVTFEYIIFKDFNDTLQDARELVDFCKHVPCKVNVIEYNPIDNGELQKAEDSRINAFCAYVQDRGYSITIRRSRGRDIDAACGQLANKNKAATALK